MTKPCNFATAKHRRRVRALDAIRQSLTIKTKRNHNRTYAVSQEDVQRMSAEAAKLHSITVQSPEDRPTKKLLRDASQARKNRQQGRISR